MRTVKPPRDRKAKSFLERQEARAEQRSKMRDACRKLAHVGGSAELTWVHGPLSFEYFQDVNETYLVCRTCGNEKYVGDGDCRPEH